MYRAYRGIFIGTEAGLLGHVHTTAPTRVYFLGAVKGSGILLATALTLLRVYTYMSKHMPTQENMLTR